MALKKELTDTQLGVKTRSFLEEMCRVSEIKDSATQVRKFWAGDQRGGRYRKGEKEEMRVRNSVDVICQWYSNESFATTRRDRDYHTCSIIRQIRSENLKITNRLEIMTGARGGESDWRALLDILLRKADCINIGLIATASVSVNRPIWLVLVHETDGRATSSDEV